MSWGDPDGPRDGTDPLDIASNAAVDAGLVLVVAAGNEGPSSGTVITPGSAEKVITVGAIDDNMNLASWCSRGP